MYSGFVHAEKLLSYTIVCSTADEIDANRHVLIVACI
jgi:hypothetical protein